MKFERQLEPTSGRIMGNGRRGHKFSGQQRSGKKSWRGSNSEHEGEQGKVGEESE